MIWLLLASCSTPIDRAALATQACPEDAVVLEDGTHQEVMSLSWDDDAELYVGAIYAYVLPDDIRSFSATVELDGIETAFALLQFDGQTWIDATVEDTKVGAWDSPPYFHEEELGSTIVAPINGDTFPEGGCLRIQPAAVEDGNARLFLRVRTEAPSEPAIDLNVVVVGDTEVFEEDIEEALDVMAEIWGEGSGPTIGSVEYYALDDDETPRAADADALRGSIVDADRADAINLFFIEDMVPSDGTLGEAGGIPGPLGLQGVDGAGVLVAVDPMSDEDGVLDTTLLATTLAHEVGHQLGLYHTTESEGWRYETLDDTAECPLDADDNGDGLLSAEECRAFDGENFMFWIDADFPQEEVSHQQGLLLAESPIVTEAP